MIWGEKIKKKKEKMWERIGHVDKIMNYCMNLQ
jgi:hypothetical protein